jgi:3-oxoacyl-[acyl-carrier protein] reductase
MGWVEDQLDFLDTDESIWWQSLDINLLAPMRFCRAVLPYMVKQQQGSIVNIASIAGRQPRPMAITYSAAKAGVIAITRSLAVAMTSHNIRVNSVSPGTIDTPQTRGADPKHLGPILAPVTLGRMCRVEDVAAAVLFMASDEVPYIVGQSLNVDGGNCML